MKVILLQDVPSLGQKDDIKEVKTGYWRNFLLPKELAVFATPKLIEQAEKRKEETAKIREEEEKKIAKELKKLKDKPLEIKAKADEKGNLFAGISAEDISRALKEEMKLEISPNAIKIEKPIKKIGEHEIPVGEQVLKIDIKPE
jgi:large subunit ribosomal protein L9